MRLFSLLFIIILISFTSTRSLHSMNKRRMYVRVPFMHNINSNQLSWIMANKENKVKKFAQPLVLNNEMESK